MRLKAYYPDALSEQLKSIADLDDIAPDMLKAAAPVVVNSVRKRVPRRTGNLARSLKAGKPKRRDRGSHYLEVKFQGYDRSHGSSPGNKRGTANAIKAAGIEYGNAHQTAQPFMDAAVHDCEQEVAEVMQMIFNAKMGGGGL